MTRRTRLNPTITTRDALGTLPVGIKGGAKAVMRRRDLPNQPDLLAPLIITETVTVNTSSTTIPSGQGSAFMPSPRVSIVGADVLHADGSQSSSYKPDWKYNNAGGYPALNSYPNPKGWGVQFDVQGSRELEFLGYMRDTATGFTTKAAWQLYLNGRRMFPLPRTTTTTANAQNLIKFTLPDADTHKVRFLGHNISLRTIFTSSGAIILNRPLKGPRVFFLGDSLTEGGSQSTGGNLGSWIWRFGEMCGFEDIWQGGMGSTGPIATNSGNAANYQTRATTDVIPANPDIVFISSYYNDRGETNSDVANAFATTINTIKAALPNAMIIVTGTYDPTGVATTQDSMGAAVQAACTARGVPYIEPKTGVVVDGAGTTVLTDAPWINSNNVSAFVGSDNVHQTDAGIEYFAYRMFNAFRALLPA